MGKETRSARGGEPVGNANSGAAAEAGAEAGDSKASGVPEEGPFAYAGRVQDGVTKVTDCVYEFRGAYVKVSRGVIKVRVPGDSSVTEATYESDSVAQAGEPFLPCILLRFRGTLRRSLPALRDREATLPAHEVIAPEVIAPEVLTPDELFLRDFMMKFLTDKTGPASACPGGLAISMRCWDEVTNAKGKFGYSSERLAQVDGEGRFLLTGAQLLSKNLTKMSDSLRRPRHEEGSRDWWMARVLNGASLKDVPAELRDLPMCALALSGITAEPKNAFRWVPKGLRAELVPQVAVANFPAIVKEGLTGELRLADWRAAAAAGWDIGSDGTVPWWDIVASLGSSADVGEIARVMMARRAQDNLSGLPASYWDEALVAAFLASSCLYHLRAMPDEVADRPATLDMVRRLSPSLLVSLAADHGVALTDGDWFLAAKHGPPREVARHAKEKLFADVKFVTSLFASACHNDPHGERILTGVLQRLPLHRKDMAVAAVRSGALSPAAFFHIAESLGFCGEGGAPDTVSEDSAGTGQSEGGDGGEDNDSHGFYMDLEVASLVMDRLLSVDVWRDGGGWLQYLLKHFMGRTPDEHVKFCEIILSSPVSDESVRNHLVQGFTLSRQNLNRLLAHKRLSTGAGAELRRAILLHNNAQPLTPVPRQSPGGTSLH